MQTRRADLHDVPAILRVVSAGEGEPDWTVEEVVDTLTGAVASWLTEDERGWAYLREATPGRDDVEVYAPAGHQAALLDLAISAAVRRGTATLRAPAARTDAAYIELLWQRGFTLHRRHARMRRTLDGSERPLDLPGVQVRPVRTDELPTFFAVLDEAFGDRQRSVEPDPAYDEWFVALVDGAIAGVLQSSSQAADLDEGWVKRLGVRAGYRRAGIGAALLATAFACYAQKGRRFAGLGVDLANPTGAYRLYRSVGLEPIFEADVYELALVGRDRRSAR